MEASQLEKAFREEVDDAVAPYLYGTSDFYRFLTEAELEACVRGNLIRDQRSTFTRLQLVIDQPEYRLDPRILKIESARLQWPDSLSTSWRDIGIYGVNEQSQYRRDYTGRPDELTMVGVDRIRFYRVPSEAGILHMDVYRAPLFDIETATDEPEIPANLHMQLLHWCFYRAYAKKDSELYDLERSKDALASFEAVFGKRPTAWAQRHRREKRSRRTTPDLYFRST